MVSNTSPSAFAGADFLAIYPNKVLSPDNSRIPALEPQARSEVGSQADNRAPRDKLPQFAPPPRGMPLALVWGMKCESIYWT